LRNEEYRQLQQDKGRRHLAGTERIFYRGKEEAVLKLTGRLIKENNIIMEATVENNDDISFRDALEECLIGLCKKLDVSVPLWLKKNTSELARFRKTSFDAEQFMEKIWFDRLEIKLQP